MGFSQHYATGAIASVSERFATVLVAARAAAKCSSCDIVSFKFRSCAYSRFPFVASKNIAIQEAWTSLDHAYRNLPLFNIRFHTALDFLHSFHTVLALQMMKSSHGAIYRSVPSSRVLFKILFSISQVLLHLFHLIKLIPPWLCHQEKSLLYIQKKIF